MKALSFIFLFIFLCFSVSSFEEVEEEIIFTVVDTKKTEESDSLSTSPLVTDVLPEEPKASSEVTAVLPEEPTVSSEVTAVLPEEPTASSDLIDVLPEEPEIILEEESPAVEELEIPKPKLDVLIVLDNSGSMKFILRTIGRKMQTFVETLSPFDYRVAFLNAEVYSDQDKRLMNLEYRGRILTQQNFLEPEMDHQILIDTLVRGRGDKCDKPPYCGKRKEKPLGALRAYLTSLYRGEFIREDSNGLAVVLITDNEENQGSESEPSATAEDILNIVSQNYSDKIFKAYTLTILDKECQREIRSKQGIFREGHFAPAVVELAERTGGRPLSLCLPSYQEIAEQMVEDFFIQ